MGQRITSTGQRIAEPTPTGSGVFDPTTQPGLAGLSRLRRAQTEQALMPAEEEAQQLRLPPQQITPDFALMVEALRRIRR